MIVMRSVRPVLFQWLRDSPRLYLRSPLHINECVERLQERFKDAESFFSGAGRTVLQGHIRWHSFSLGVATQRPFRPVFYGSLTRLGNGTLISGHFTMPKLDRLKLAFLALGLSSFLFYLPALWAPLPVVVRVASWLLAAIVLAGGALMKSARAGTVALFAEFLEKTLEAELTSRKE